MPGLDELAWMAIGACLPITWWLAVTEIRYQRWQRQTDTQQVASARVGAAAWTLIRSYSRPGFRWRETTPKENP